MSFLSSATKTFWETNDRWQLLKPGEKVLVAVSGGVDSMVLLHLLLHLPKPKRVRVTVVHYDHRLRGRQSAREAHFVLKTCETWGVPCFVGRAEPWKDKSNLHDRARRLRYDFFMKTAQKLRIQKILTAHQANDQTENFMMRWIQGSGLKGLSGISLIRKEGRFCLVRPLLFLSRSDIYRYAQEKKIPFFEDPSNQNDRYLRSRLRRWISKLEKENPRIVERTAVNTIFLRADDDFIKVEIERRLKLKMFKKNGQIGFPLQWFRKLPPACRYRAYVWMMSQLLKTEVRLSPDKVLKMDECVLKSGNQTYDLGYGLSFWKKDPEKIIIASRKSPC